jgi:hypothetical protein
VHKAQEILVGVAEAYTSPDTRLKVGSRSRQIKGDHTLVGIPDIHHSIRVIIGCPYLKRAQSVIPVPLQLSECLTNILNLEEVFDDRTHGSLVDRLGTLRQMLEVSLILMVSKKEDQSAGLAWFKRHRDVMRANGRPSVGY